MLKRFLLACGLLLVACSTAQAAPAIGTDTAYPGTSVNAAGTAQIYRFRAAANGSVDTLHVHLASGSTASGVEVALYGGTATAAGARKRDCVITSPQAGAWNACTPTLGAYSIVSGSYYWLAVLQPAGSSGQMIYSEGQVTGGPTTYLSRSSSLASLPSTWSNGQGFTGGYQGSLYGDAATGGGGGGGGGGCDLNATTSTFATQFAAAQAGQTLCLASGSYGTFTGGQKSGRVTIQPATGATVSMSLNFTGSSNITLTGLNLSGAWIGGASHDLSILNSTISPGGIELITDQFNQANILIDHDTFPNQRGGDGRVWTEYNTTNTTNTIGVTVSHSLFSGGSMIDILIEGGAGLRVIDNEFTGMNNTLDPAIHSDTIFNYGDQGGNVIKGNWFHDQVDVPACGWAEWDGGHDNVFENNVVSHAGGPIGSDGCYEGMSALDDHNSLIDHNVFEPGAGESGTNVGAVDLGGKTSEGAGSGTIIRDNTFSSISNCNSGLCSTYSENHNVCSQACDGGLGDVNGSPTWTGGPQPTTWDGFHLAAGSLGKSGASDGSDVGILPSPS